MRVSLGGMMQPTRSVEQSDMTRASATSAAKIRTDSQPGVSGSDVDGLAVDDLAVDGDDVDGHLEDPALEDSDVPAVGPLYRNRAAGSADGPSASDGQYDDLVDESRFRESDRFSDSDRFEGRDRF